MAVSYKKLWKLPIDRDLIKKELCRLSTISTVTVTKMDKGGYVSTEVLKKICKARNSKVEDIMEITEG
ncbi:helix-turn-helix domain-containing protein [Marasmitruncus massiliensis]|uniref:helix-turn-helix domain-containing protein n=1 Tax=Marasmitruncus massiliensis TaxID=1944642 RepID=UPI000C7C33F0|nr:helix-turn-helix transcriptional regulator [Marasmitruncus massiliensis]